VFQNAYGHDVRDPLSLSVRRCVNFYPEDKVYPGWSLLGRATGDDNSGNLEGELSKPRVRSKMVPLEFLRGKVRKGFSGPREKLAKILAAPRPTTAPVLARPKLT
jgi:hypothetical protein